MWSQFATHRSCCIQTHTQPNRISISISASNMSRYKHKSKPPTGATAYHAHEVEMILTRSLDDRGDCLIVGAEAFVHGEAEVLHQPLHHELPVCDSLASPFNPRHLHRPKHPRSEERRVGHEGVSRCR